MSRELTGVLSNPESGDLLVSAEITFTAKLPNTPSLPMGAGSTVTTDAETAAYDITLEDGTYYVDITLGAKSYRQGELVIVDGAATDIFSLLNVVLNNKIPHKWMGAWSPTVPAEGYAIGDEVQRGGRSFISLKAGNLGNTPPAVGDGDAYWDLLTGGTIPTYAAMYRSSATPEAITHASADVPAVIPNMSSGLVSEWTLDGPNGTLQAGANAQAVYDTAFHLAVEGPTGTKAIMGVYVDGVIQANLTARRGFSGGAELYPASYVQNYGGPIDYTDYDGNVVAGETIESLAEQNGIYMRVPEVSSANPGFEVDFTFNSSTAPGKVRFAGNYNGSITHEVELLIWNFTASTWDALRTSAEDIPDTAGADINRGFTVPGTPSDYHDAVTNTVKVRLAHGTTSSNTHNMYVDKLSVVSHTAFITVSGAALLNVTPDQVVDLRIESDTAGVVHNVFDAGVKLANAVMAQSRTDTLVRTLNQPGLLKVVTGNMRWRPHQSISISGISAEVGEVPDGQSILIDVLKNGSSILASLLEIVAGANQSSLIIPAITGVTNNDYITVNIEQVGTFPPGENLVLQIQYGLV